MKYKLTVSQHLLLCEAFRRLECFSVRRNGCKWELKAMQDQWTGLGTKTLYKPAVDHGFMKRVSPDRRGMAWWQLTELGAKIVLAWHNAGYGFNSNHELNFQPPLQCEGTLDDPNKTLPPVLDT
jgi:hypothetical protein